MRQRVFVPRARRSDFLGQMVVDDRPLDLRSDIAYPPFLYQPGADRVRPFGSQPGATDHPSGWAGDSAPTKLPGYKIDPREQLPKSAGGFVDDEIYYSQHPELTRPGAVPTGISKPAPLLVAPVTTTAPASLGSAAGGGFLSSLTSWAGDHPWLALAIAGGGVYLLTKGK